MHAVKRTAVIIGAEAATNFVSGLIPIGTGTSASVPLTLAKQAGVGLGLAVLAKKFMPNYAEDVLVGALLAPMTTLAKQLPIIGTSLSGAPPGLGTYGPPRALRGAPPGLGKVGTYAKTLDRGPSNARLVNRLSGAGLPISSYYD